MVADLHLLGEGVRPIGKHVISMIMGGVTHGRIDAASQGFGGNLA